MKSRITSGADPWGDVNKFGAGKLDAYRALVSFQTLVDGPNFIWTSGYYTWKADIIGGAGGPYTYAWASSPDGRTWSNAGTASTYSQYVSLGDPMFYLKVTFTSHGVQASNTEQVRTGPPR